MLQQHTLWLRTSTMHEEMQSCWARVSYQLGHRHCLPEEYTQRARPIPDGNWNGHAANNGDLCFCS
jgi:hypothetical protein